MINEQRHLLVEDLLREATIRTWLYMNPKIMLNVLISGSKEPTLEFKSKNQTTYTYMNIDKFTFWYEDCSFLLQNCCGFFPVKIGLSELLLQVF